MSNLTYNASINDGDFSGLICSNFLFKSYLEGKKVEYDFIRLEKKEQTVNKLTKILEENNFMVIRQNNTELVGVYGDNEDVVAVNYDYELRFWFTSGRLKTLKKNIEEKINIQDSVGIFWYVDKRSGTRFVPMDKSRLPVTEMFPFLQGKELSAYYNEYFNSNSNVIILLGKPGMGKTTFIRGMLTEKKKSAYLTYNIEELRDDNVYATFFSSEDADFFIFEDADEFLKPRKEGNDVMIKFLNLGDGLISNKNKKFIFTANIEDIKNIDSALLRSGRCFDVIMFNPLEREDAEILAEKFDMNLSEDKDSYTISEIFNKKIKKPTRKDVFGFR